MKKIAERRIVVVLFILVIITFSFAHEDSKKIEQVYSGKKIIPAVEFTASQNTIPDNFEPVLSKIPLKKK